MTSRQQTESLLAVLREPLDSSGLDLEAVELSTAGRRTLVRVLVDKDGGVTLDDLADATTLVGDRLDDANALGDRPYTLEVTSPGVDRPLTASRHWRRNLGRLVKVTLVDGGTVTGRILEAGADSVTLDVDGVPRVVGYDAVGTARVQVEFNRRARKEA